MLRHGCSKDASRSRRSNRVANHKQAREKVRRLVGVTACKRMSFRFVLFEYLIQWRARLREKKKEITRIFNGASSGRRPLWGFIFQTTCRWLRPGRFVSWSTEGVATPSQGVRDSRDSGLKIHGPYGWFWGKCTRFCCHFAVSCGPLVVYQRAANDQTGNQVKDEEFLFYEKEFFLCIAHPTAGHRSPRVHLAPV